MPVHTGRPTRIAGWLGAFEVTWTRSNPIDADLCTRCNACIEVCPEQAIDFSYQIDLAKCTGHRDCVRACGAAAAIDFERAAEEQSERFDLVLDLQDTASIALHQPPQGYFHAVADADLFAAVLRLRESVGEFEKPKFFDYKQKICAHTRNGQIGCSACIDVCSAAAIRSDAETKGRSGTGGIVVDPHLCVGCGACTTVCPSGALTYAAPRPHELGKRIRTMLATYARAGGRDAALLIHSQEAGASVIETLGRAARIDAALHGLPARVLPLEVWHTASVGIDLWLAAIAFGAAQVWVLVTHEEAPAYREAIDAQMKVAQAILAGLGFVGEHFRIVGAGEVSRLQAGADASGPATSPAPLRSAPTEPAPAASRRGAASSRRGDGSARRDLRRSARQADDARPRLRASAARSADAGRRDRAADAGRGAEPVRRGRRRQGHLHLVPGVRRRLPEGALVDHPDSPRLQLHREELRPVRSLREHLPRRRDHARAAPAARRRRQGAAADRASSTKPSRFAASAAPSRSARCARSRRWSASSPATRCSRAAPRSGLQMCGDCRVIDLHSDPGEVRITEL